MTYLPSLYKARGVPLKTHGVRIWLCQAHHSVAFLRSNAGRDFAVTLLRTWRAHGCLTRARSRALDAHLAAARSLGRSAARARPGSYAWPRLRREAEEAFALGAGVFVTIARLRARHARDHASVPSIRTMRRWFTQGRWLRAPA